MSLAVLFHFLCAQYVSDINISIIRSLRLCFWITTSVVFFSVHCVLEIWCGCNTDTTQTQPHQISNTKRTENKTTDVVIQQDSRKLLMIDILLSETWWIPKKWNKIASDIKLVFYSSTIRKPIGVFGSHANAPKNWSLVSYWHATTGTNSEIKFSWISSTRWTAKKFVTNFQGFTPKCQP